MSTIALIVEDEAPLRLFYETILDDMGYSVIQTSDGEEALAVLQQTVPGIILLDMLLPRVDGVTVLEHIQANPCLQNIPIVVLTAHSRFESVVDLSAVDSFLLKPVRPDEIRTAVQHVLAPL